jgi:hypothetical protein
MNKIIYVVMVIIIIFIFFLIINNNIFLNKSEKFSTQTGELSQFTKEYILKDCKDNWAKDNNSSIDWCNKNAWVTNPKLLCGICGDSKSNPLYGFNSPKKNSARLYGCSVNSQNSIGLSWNIKNQISPIHNLLGSKQTCNKNNINAKSGMYIYSCGDDNITIRLNNKVIISDSGWNILHFNYIDDVKYDDEIIITGENICGGGAFCISYFWNKELYILDNNGFENSANIINYTSNNYLGWSKNVSNYMTDLLPWMKNWISLKNVSCDNVEKSYGTLSFKVGHTKNQGSLNNDLNVFLGIDDFGTVLLNNNIVYEKSEIWNVFVNFIIPDVKIDDILTINCTNAGGPGGIGITYLWGGQIYTLPSTLTGFNSTVNILNYSSTNTGDLNYTGLSSIENNLHFLTNWINGPAEGNFSITTIIGQNGYVYSPTNNIWYTPIINNIIGEWSSLNIKSNTSMTISFMIKIIEVGSDWRNIFHVTNTGYDCCSLEGDRVPGIWITPQSTTLHISNATTTNGNDVMYTNSILLNTPTQVDINFNGKYIYVFFNNKLVNTFNHISTPIPAKKTATVYIQDPWSTTKEVYQIKNFTLRNL